ncbi:MAG: hypothetical protein COV75_03320 [Candidatus Omnitrophica bacterium CG11_big_fil_rev_8_21_14_0_20_63_9]|nr:MAG: hypothetical protein COV75_03320 [Candidatus Omnitrophica bacterium CG11_big_fil_rev_8_21_14_0_20_63_9]
MYDAIVVGAGPAGSVCARQLGRDGQRVLLLDRGVFPRDKACGDALTGKKTLRALQAMGLCEAFLELHPAASVELLVVGPSGRRCRLVSTPNQEALRENYVCPRRIFDQWLLAQCRPWVEVREGIAVTEVGIDETGVTVSGRELSSGRALTFHSRLVVGADGASSLVARAAGLRPARARAGAAALRGYFSGCDVSASQLEFYMLRDILPGYLWVFPLGEGVANIGIGLAPQRSGCPPESLAKFLWNALGTHPALAPRFRHARLEGRLEGWVLPQWNCRARLSRDRALLIGDAAGLVDPLTGEGIGNAIVSGQLAAAEGAEALRAGDLSASRLRRYDRQVHRRLGPELQLAALGVRLLQAPWLVDGLIALADSQPWMGRALSALIGAPEGKRELLTVAGWRRLWRAVALET